MSMKESVPNIRLFTPRDRVEYFADLTQTHVWNRFPK